MEHKKILELLNSIDPAQLNYQEWVNVGMSLQYEGFPAEVWEEWSAKDSARYRPGECISKYATFKSSGITAGTLYQLAVEKGFYTPLNYSVEEDRELSWNDSITKDYDNDYKIIDKSWIESREIIEPSDKKWDPVSDITRYLEILFDSTEYVNYVTETYQIVDKKTGEIIHKPTKGSSSRTAGELVQKLNNCNGDIGSVLGDYKPEVGAWIRFNPLDGKGVNNDNITDYRYALVESDKTELGRQNTIIRELELPVACLVHSGNKSIHAIVRIDAKDYEEYRKRVDYLYKICNKNGLDIDTQNKNPSRLSRLPGVMRNGHKQFLIDTNIGKKNWEEWFEWIEGINDDLPDPEGLEAFWNDLPPLAEPLIDGVLRKGHKMLIAGPSKAGKSFALIELCIAIAEGKKWLKWPCLKGRVLYVNLELDRASCLHRFKDVYDTLKLPPNGVHNIDIWNLRGKSIPLDKLAPKLIRRAQKRQYIAVVIDPIYKVITGDENSADQMAHFTNQFDKVATELNCAVIYCHHHSKGLQGGKKSMDRASGSGVFARDPDALLDLIELEKDSGLIKFEQDKAIIKISVDILKKYKPSYIDDLSQDDLLSPKIITDYCNSHLGYNERQILNKAIDEELLKIKLGTTWRIEGTLREFPKFDPIDMWFNYPIHKVDEDGVLKDLIPEGEVSPFQSKNHKSKISKTKEKTKEEKLSKLEIAYSTLELSGKTDITYGDLAEEMEVSKDTVKRRVKNNPVFYIENIDNKTAYIRRKNDNEENEK